MGNGYIHRALGQLKRHKIAVSISEPNEPSTWGYGENEVNEFTLDLSKSLIAHGAEVIFGHDWRPDGVMMALYEYAEESDAVLADEEKRNDALITNFREHGHDSKLPDWQIERLKGVLNIKETSAPDNSEQFNPIAAKACAFSVMRREMTKHCSARISLGGRDIKPGRLETAPLGRGPGVLEEILLSIALGQPIFLSRLFGGVTAVVIDALEGNCESNINFDYNDQLKEFYNRRERIHRIEELHSPESDYQAFDFASIQRDLAEFGVGGLSKLNGLSVEENIHLFNATSSVECTNRLLIGLRRHC